MSATATMKFHPNVQKQIDAREAEVKRQELRRTSLADIGRALFDADADFTVEDQDVNDLRELLNIAKARHKQRKNAEKAKAQREAGPRQFGFATSKF